MTAMIGMMTPLEETPAFRSIFAKGESAQLVRQIERLERSYRDGLLSEQAYLDLVPPLQKDLDDIRRMLKKG